eukprot:scaffold56220_cov66-Phaeocystis_antarctica.AAC.4
MPRKSPEITPFHQNHGFSSPQRCKFSKFFLLGLRLRFFLNFRKSWDRASRGATAPSYCVHRCSNPSRAGSAYTPAASRPRPPPPRLPPAARRTR